MLNIDDLVMVIGQAVSGRIIGISTGMVTEEIKYNVCGIWYTADELERIREK